MTDLDLGLLRTDATRAVVAARQEARHGVTAEHFASFKPEVVLALIDRIEALEAALARVTDDSMAERIEGAIQDAYVTTPALGNVPWLSRRQAGVNALAAIRAAVEKKVSDG